MPSHNDCNSNASTTSLQSSTTVTSTSPLNGTPKAPIKDYSAAFATLQSRYGTGGHVPTPKAEQSKATAPITATQSDNTLTSRTSSSSPTPKNPSAGESGIDVKKKRGLVATLKDKLKSG